MTLDTLPTLNTQRLVLRPFRPEDAAAVQRLASHPDIASTTANIPHPYGDGVAVLLRDESGRVQSEYDHHILGLFSRSEWLELHAQVGFEARAIPFVHSEVPAPMDVFIGVRPMIAKPVQR